MIFCCEYSCKAHYDSTAKIRIDGWSLMLKS